MGMILLYNSRTLGNVRRKGEEWESSKSYSQFWL